MKQTFNVYQTPACEVLKLACDESLLVVTTSTGATIDDWIENPDAIDFN